MSRKWQVRQIIRFEDMYCVNRCANFGSAASPKIWCLVFTLVLWIAVNKMGVSL